MSSSNKTTLMWKYVSNGCSSRLVWETQVSHEIAVTIFKTSKNTPYLSVILFRFPDQEVNHGMRLNRTIRKLHSLQHFQSMTQSIRLFLLFLAMQVCCLLNYIFLIRKHVRRKGYGIACTWILKFNIFLLSI